MKAKNLGLMTLSILALVMLVGFTSAAFELVPSTVTQTVDQGTTSVTFNIFADNDGLGGDYALTWTGTPSQGSIVYPTLTTSTDGANESTSFTINSISPTFFGTITGTLVAESTLVDRTVDFTINVNEVPTPEEVSACLLLGDTDNALDLEIEDITVTSGFGDDNEWLPLDTIEVEVKAENNDNDYKIEDLEIKWGLFDLDTMEWVFDEEESDFNIKDGDDKTIYLTYKLEDPDDFEDNGNYVFFVWAEGVDEETDENICEVVSEDIDVIIESDFVVLDNFKVDGVLLDDLSYPDTIECGSLLQITADIWNIGEDDQEDITIEVYDKDLGIDETLEIGDIDAFDSETFNFEFIVPEGIDEEWHTLQFTVYDEDNEVYENDYDDQESVFDVLLDIEGNCALAEATVSASLESESKAGKDLEVKVTITNPGTKEATYYVSAAGFAEWASGVAVSPDNFVLGAGQSRDVFLTFDVNSDASGENLFNVEVMSEDELILSQAVSVPIEKSLTGKLFGENSLTTGLIIGIAVILILIIIVFAIRVARK